MHFFKRMAFASILASTLAAPSAFSEIVTLPASALNPSPGVYTPQGYYTNQLGKVAVMTGGENAAHVGWDDGRNDDGFMQLNLGFALTFFGTSYSSLYLNNNGNVSFGAGIAAFVPTGPTGANAPVISPFFSDVDTRNVASDMMMYQLSKNQLVVTWDNVGSFDRQGRLRNSFQLVLRGDDYVVPAGEGSIGFFYQDMAWEEAQTSKTAAVGFGDGKGNAIVIAGSNLPGMNTLVNDQYIWFDAQLAPVPPVEPVAPSEVPEPGSTALLALGLLGAGLFSRRHLRG